ncbi:transcription factor DP [Nitzschia inconspicua]|uniref:Transcription factor DP n=1 Tax=Nitzschia inconspicua TaxID=303405 RepID=A0A9K3L223_9STRA|nr:transcription factor DP [Nitzschia inconspicua]
MSDRPPHSSQQTSAPTATAVDERNRHPSSTSSSGGRGTTTTTTSIAGNKRTAPTPPSTDSRLSTPASKKHRTAATSSTSNTSSGGIINTSAANQSTPRASPTNSIDGKASRGLRHFSMMVCQKVEEKGTTTYNEVADELVKQVVADRMEENPDGKCDEKNIRRRVYDALNVLMAMDIISKDKKEITWRGLPTAAKQNMESMQKEIEYRRFQIDRKKEALRDLLTQQVCFRNLVSRNQEAGMADEKIPLPFIVVNTNSSAVIQCDMSRDRTDVMFDFSMPFEINDDNTILKKMGMDRTSLSTLRQMLPDDLLRYCQTNRLVDNVLGRSENPIVSHPYPYHQHQQQAAGARMHSGPPPTPRGRYY